MMPSQSSSLPLHVSGCGVYDVQHEPGENGVQSSITPLQSSSMPLHVSTVGHSAGLVAHVGALHVSLS